MLNVALSFSNCRLTTADVRLDASLDGPPASLVRGWIRSGLNAQREDTVQSTIERISADVQRLRELVA